MFKNRAIKKYFNELPQLLQQRYGQAENFSKGQILTTIRDCGLNQKHSVYALAIFLEQDVFISLEEEYSDLDLNAVREDIANRFFEGDLTFSYAAHRSRYVGNPDGGGGADAGGD